MEKNILNEEIKRMRQIINISEGSNFNFQYSDEKINEFLVEAEKTVQNAEASINKYGSMVVNLTVKYVFENMDKVKKDFADFTNIKKNTESKYNKFYDIVEVYDFMDRPDNISKLEDFATDLDNHVMSMSEFLDLFEEIIRTTERLARNNKDILTIQTFD